MLETLNQFDWVALEGNTQPWVPRLLVALTSPISEEQDKAFGQLIEFLAPMLALEGRYAPADVLKLVDRELIIVTIPFLIELSCSDEFVGKEKPLEILHDLVWYCGVENYAPQDQLEEYRRLTRRIYDAVDQGSACYETLSHSDEKWTSLTAIDVMTILEKYRHGNGVQPIADF
jgi:hypothetical protein